MKEILFLVLGYVMGALPNGVWIGKYFKKIVPLILIIERLWKHSCKRLVLTTTNI